MQPALLPVSLRTATPADLPFVLNAFARSFEAARLAESADRPVIHQGARRLVAALFERGGVTVAEPEGSPDVLAGFLLHAGGDLLVWAYTKSRYRRAGVASALLRHAFGPDGPPMFCLFHGGFAARLRQRGCLYSPLSLAAVGAPGPLGEHVLEALR